MITIAAPEIGPEEIDLVNEVLQSGMIAQGAKTAALEEAFAAYCGTEFAVAVNSGTAAIHAALHAAGVGPGDEVITTPFSFIATINPILMAGARPVLVDIDPVTFNIDPAAVAAAVTAKTKAIIPVHLYGQPCDWEQIHKTAQDNGLIVIEDACQAIGSAYGDTMAGNLGDLGCFSLYATKNIMCGEGGIVTTNNAAYAAAMRSFRQHGMTAPYEYAGLGYNYRLTDLQAAIALAQVEKIGRFTEARQQTAALFNEGLAGIPGVILPQKAANRTHVYHQYTIRLTDTALRNRDELQTALKERGVGSGIYYPKPLHAYPHVQELGYKLGDFPQAEKAAAEVISLPVHPKVSPADAQLIIDRCKELLNG